MITFLRSVVFNVFYVAWTLVVGTLYLPLLMFPSRWMVPAVRYWGVGLVWGARILLGIRWRVEGRENLPAGGCIVASKHQSAWETLFLLTLLDRPVYILKKELFSIPFVGWYMRKVGTVAIDRKAGAAALKYMLRGAAVRVSEGRQIIIFPEGTRVAPGDTSKPYKPGVAALYAHLGDTVPVVPVALNAGLFWGRNSFIKRPGEVVVRILPPMPAGLDKKVFLTTLRDRIEAATNDLCGVPVPQVP